MSIVPAIPLQPEYDKGKIKTKTFKYNVGPANNRRKEEILLPTYDKGPREELLRMIMEFNTHADTLGWTTPNDKFTKFESLLQGIATSVWKVLIQDLDRNTEDGWDEAIDRFKKKKNLGGIALRNQRSYLRNLRKPRDMTVEDFSNRIQYINLLLAEFPDATEDDKLSEGEIKEILFKAMPESWRDAFIDSGRELNDETLEDLERYMTNQKAKSDVKQQRQGGFNNNNSNGKRKRHDNNRRNGSNNYHNNNNGNGNHSNNNNNNRQQGNRQQNNRRQGHQANKNSRQGRPNKGNRTQADDPCPLAGHQNHTWGDCWSNANNPNRRQNNNNQQTPNKNNRNNNGNNRERESHQVQQQERKRQSKSNNTRSNRNRTDPSSDDDTDDDQFFCHLCSDNEFSDDDRDQFFFVHEELEPEYYPVDDTTDNIQFNNNTSPSQPSTPNKRVAFTSEVKGATATISTNLEAAIESDGNQLCAMPDELRREMRTQHSQQPNVVPETLVTAAIIGSRPGRYQHSALLDSGGSDVMISYQALPKGVTLYS